MPAPEPRVRSDADLPGDPTGDPKPHDILAAEEFAMPAPDGGPRAEAGRAVTAPAPPRWAGVAGAGLLALWLRRRRR